ncbi:MAG: sigma factor-like helix-turn-helix DNA-binding protein [Planctomycetota bacterium]
MSNEQVETKKRHLKEFLTTKLTTMQRQLVILYYYEEMTTAEVARIVGWSEIQVSQMLSSIICRCKFYVHRKL